MFTVCPKCALTLVVTAGDLRIGQGYVRCGRCSNVFNALVGLSEERQAALTGQPVTGQPAPAPGAATPEAAPSVADVPIDSPEDNDADVVPDSALEFNADSTDVGEVFIEPRPGPHDVASGTFETIVLEANDLLENSPDAANDGDAEQTPAANDASLEDEMSGAASVPNDAGAGQPREESTGFDRSRIETPRPRREIFARAAEVPVTDTVAESVVLEVDSGHSRRRTLAWSVGAAALVILFGAQLVHHYRHELAVDARFREPLSALYGSIGVSLAPRWNLSAYEVRQLGASAGGPAGMLTVRASVQNSGENPQPLPLLRVTVQDRFGNRIAATDVAPSAYARRAAAISAFLEAGERVDAEIRLSDPGPNAVGFELDACLPFEGGHIGCANEQRAR